MLISGKRITVFGGSGFICRYLIRRLAAEGWVVRVAVRRPVAAEFLKPAGNVGQIVPLRCDVLDDAAVAAAMAGSEMAVNLVGALYERGRQRLPAVHVDAAARIARAAKAAGASRLVHVSAMGAAADALSRYGRTKAEGEEAVRAAYPGATILRPSVVIGPEDDFFNRFACIARYAPAFPLIGGGRTRLQPVYVGDVAAALQRVLDEPATAGKTYELGGPRIYTLREAMELMLRVVGRSKKRLVSVPYGLTEFGAMFLQLLPTPPLTRDQVRMLESDNVAAAGAAGFAQLGLQPQAIEAILPGYLEIYRPGGRYAPGRFA